jgi:hypothetical protein
MTPPNHLSNNLISHPLRQTVHGHGLGPFVEHPDNLLGESVVPQEKERSSMEARQSRFEGGK